MKRIHIALRQATSIPSAKPHPICNAQCFQSAFRPPHFFQNASTPTSNSTLTLVVIIVVLITRKISTQTSLHSQENRRSTFLPVERSKKQYRRNFTPAQFANWTSRQKCQTPPSCRQHIAPLHTVIFRPVISQASMMLCKVISRIESSFLNTCIVFLSSDTGEARLTRGCFNAGDCAMRM